MPDLSCTRRGQLVSTICLHEETASGQRHGVRGGAGKLLTVHVRTRGGRPLPAVD